MLKELADLKVQAFRQPAFVFFFFELQPQVEAPVSGVSFVVGGIFPGCAETDKDLSLFKEGDQDIVQPVVRKGQVSGLLSRDILQVEAAVPHA